MTLRTFTGAAQILFGSSERIALVKYTNTQIHWPNTQIHWPNTPVIVSVASPVATSLASNKTFAQNAFLMAVMMMKMAIIMMATQMMMMMREIMILL